MSLLFGVVLSGCGFHLRGSESALPEAMARTYVGVDAHSGLHRALRLQLQAAGVEVVDQPARGDARLQVMEERFERRVLSVSGDVAVSEYELSYSVRYRAEIGGREVIAPQELTVVRDYRFDPDAVLAKADEESLLRREMQRDMADMMLRRVRYAAGAAESQRP